MAVSPERLALNRSAVAAYVLPEFGQHLPEAVRVQVCQAASDAPDSLRPVLLYSFYLQVSGSMPIDRKTSATSKTIEVALEQLHEIDHWQPTLHAREPETEVEEPLRLTLGRLPGRIDRLSQLSSLGKMLLSSCASGRLPTPNIYCRYFFGIGCVRQSNGPSAPLPRMRVSKNCRFEGALSRPCTVAASISQ
jgi:hypothetical protein